MAQIRVSIANLAIAVRQQGRHGLSLQRRYFGILNPKKLEKGERQYQALGGAAMLTEVGKSVLEEVTGATNFELDKETGFYDARFQIDESDLDCVFQSFSRKDDIYGYEQDRTLDIMHELTGKAFPGHPSLLAADEAVSIEIAYMTAVIQRQSAPAADTSARGASADVPTRRLFRFYDLVMPESLMGKFFSSPVVRELTYEELKSTKGGSCAGRTSDGFVIQNNLLWPT